jgi:uncharacterized protein (DUF433 family)
MERGVIVDGESSVSLLAQPVMTAREAARQLRIPPSTVVHWLEGGTRRGKWYPPILRDDPLGYTDITWGEVVEARYLRAYRKQRVSMQQLRPFIRALRDEFGVPYPLAHYKPFIGEGRRLIADIQERLDLPTDLRVVYEVTTGQQILNAAVLEFLDRVDFAPRGDREALRLLPAGKESPVVMDPRFSSAASTVEGVRTEVLAELHDAGVPPEGIAADFGLPLSLVRAAISWEWAAAA